MGKAEELYQRGDLEKLFLMPLDFGGQDIPVNTLFVPLGTAALKADIDATIARLASNGTVRRYTATPEYQGDSVIPIAIRVVASDPGEFVGVVNIWGAALDRADGKD